MDLRQHLLRQMAFSHATFGPGKRTNGVIDHIKKELNEIIADGGVVDPSEWVDVVILALDGLTRELAYNSQDKRSDPEKVADDVCKMILFKQTRNESRNWPNWRVSDPNKAIEHVK